MVTVANPIYDVVFKYLMEDERIARIILSALLKMEVVRVEVRPHEYSNSERDTLSIFRIDFGATVRDADGKEKLILVELQKTWVETETLRFRQYLGVQYRSPKNMVGDYALPTVAVYLLGHKVGDIEEPVVYVDHVCYNYDGRRVVKGLPDPFIESLTHNSIIVQIPRLHGQINNRLDKVLSVFDQSRRDKDDEQVLHINEHDYTGDSDMAEIINRLTRAAADADMRRHMDVEDEYFSIIEKRDTEILQKDQKLAEQNVQLREQEVQLTEQKAQLTEQEAQLTEQKAQLTEQKAQLTEQKAQLTEQKAQLTEKDAQLTEKEAQLTEKEAQLTEQKAQLTEQEAQLTEQKKALRTTVDLLLQAGMTIDEIATRIGKTVEEIRGIS
jgi:hypothetical protein